MEFQTDAFNFTFWLANEKQHQFETPSLALQKLIFSSQENTPVAKIPAKSFISKYLNQNNEFQN